MASIVARIRGSSAGRNPTIGIIRLEASSSAESNDWVNAPTSSFHPRSLMVASWISSQVAAHSGDAVLAAQRRSASAMARSSATQHISLEYTKSRGRPRTSQMPWSCSTQRPPRRRPSRS